VQLVEPADMSLDLVHDQLVVDDVVPKRGKPAGPLALAARGGDLVAGPLGNHLALELGEGRHKKRGPLTSS
jgi:hypothetical protein